MQVGDLITHIPTGGVGTIIANHGHRVLVYWCVEEEVCGEIPQRIALWTPDSDLEVVCK